MTGAASGIGRATAVALAADGHSIVAVDRDEAGLASLANEIDAEIHATDLANPDQRDELVAAAGSLDVLINAAGVIRLTPVDEVTLDEWRFIQSVNAEAVFFLCQQLSRSMNDGGSIVNLSSSAAKTGTTVEAAAYAASKAAVLSISRAFAFHLASRDINVNAVCPGVIDTPMQDQVIAGLADARGVETGEVDQRRLSTVPLGRAATAEETAGVICWLAGPHASYLTAQSINVCGGLVTW